MIYTIIRIYPLALNRDTVSWSGASSDGEWDPPFIKSVGKILLLWAKMGRGVKRREEERKKGERKKREKGKGRKKGKGEKREERKGERKKRDKRIKKRGGLL